MLGAIKKFIYGFLTPIVLAAVGGLVAMYIGVYNVAASAPHTGPERWIFETITHRSIAARAGTVEVPAVFTNEQRQAGFEHYNEMCVVCHGAPGVNRGDIGEGLTPQPPDLKEAARRGARNEMFWIVQNGIKMTGMPSFGATHSDQEVWSIVAFVASLSDMTAEQYTSLVRVSEETSTEAKTATDADAVDEIQNVGYVTETSTEAETATDADAADEFQNIGNVTETVNVPEP